MRRCKGSSPLKKNGKKRGHCPLWAIPPPKRVKRGHLLSYYRQKCVNGTRDSYCGVKSPFPSDLRLILTHIVVSKDSYWLILWCQKSISEWFETHIVVSKVHFWVIWESGKFGLKKGTGVDPRPPLVDNVPFFYRFFFRRASLSGNAHPCHLHSTPSSAANVTANELFTNVQHK